ncbi:hypothetical protein [Rubellimicrobium arenae]|uniref:hypothetical protein n=1 Tax=Rubellimicrobium arenae TaxID=2817372 RepID=UPI001B30D258|nr:hypothetical protein [Rubellimicrobium arenae]
MSDDVVAGPREAALHEAVWFLLRSQRNLIEIINLLEDRTPTDVEIAQVVRRKLEMSRELTRRADKLLSS